MLEIGLDSDPYSTFLFAMRSPKTKEKVEGRLRMFFDFVGIPAGSMEERSRIFMERGKEDQNWVFGTIVKYLQSLKERFERKEITAGTIKNRYQAIRLFCDMSDIPISWKKISRGLPKVRKYADDRAPTLEEIRKLVEYPDRRIKAIVYTMASSGIRLGAWDYLKWKHLVPLEKNGRIVAGRIMVYAGEDEQYFSFITPEAYRELQKWKDYRIQSGEKEISDDSWIMRNIWNTKKGYMRGLVSAPLKLKSEGVKRLVDDGLWTQGIRKSLPTGKKRHEFQVDHGFRKWFKTRCEMSGMKPINVEILMNHSTGISDSYYRATQSELLEDYLKAIDFLTISEDHILQDRIAELSRKNRDNDYIVSTKLQKKEEEIISLSSRLESIQNQIQDLVSTFTLLPESSKEELAKKLIQNGILESTRSPN